MKRYYQKGIKAVTHTKVRKSRKKQMSDGQIAKRNMKRNARRSKKKRSAEVMVEGPVEHVEGRIIMKKGPKAILSEGVIEGEQGATARVTRSMAKGKDGGSVRKQAQRVHRVQLRETVGSVSKRFGLYVGDFVGCLSSLPLNKYM